MGFGLSCYNFNGGQSLCTCIAFYVSLSLVANVHAHYKCIVFHSGSFLGGKLLTCDDHKFGGCSIHLEEKYMAIVDPFHKAL